MSSFSFVPGPQPAEDDVGPDAPVGALADRGRRLTGRLFLVLRRKRPALQGEGDTSVHMRGEHPLGELGVARQGAVQQRPVLLDRNLPSEHHRHHLITQILVENPAIQIEQGLRAAGRDEGVVKLAVVALPQLRLAVARHHPPFQGGELVVRGDDAALPFEIARRERQRHGVALEQEPHRRDILEAGRGHRRHREPALPFGEDEAFRGQAAQDLAQRADAGAIALRQPIETEPQSRRQAAEDDVGPNLLVSPIGDRGGEELDAHRRSASCFCTCTIPTQE